MTHPIALFTDFGSQDIYVGQLHSVAKRNGSGGLLIDLFHDVNAFDISAGASLLAAMLNYLPDNSVLLGVVDPGVGGERLPIAVELGDRWLVGPDNGLFSRSIAWASSKPRYWTLDVATNVATTFHGRDVFLPAAIQLASDKLEGMHRVEDPDNLLTHRKAVGLTADDHRVIHVDHYGNLISGIRNISIKSSQTIGIAGQNFSHADYYELVTPGDCFWHVNSLGLLEVSTNQGSAAQILNVKSGAEIVM